MQGIFLNVHELDALEGLPWGVVSFYVLALRPLMDATTRTVGVRSAVSWGRLGLTINPAPHPGYQTPRVNKSAARRMGAALERAGLVRMQSSNEPRQLVFFLPLAGGFSLAQKKADTKPTHQADTPPTEGGGRASRHTPRAKAGIYQGSRDKTSTPSAPTRKPTATPPEATGGEGFIFPEGINDKGRTALARALAGLDCAQDVLDELGARMALGGLSYPVRYGQKLAQQAQAGEFIPERAQAYRQQREAQARALVALQRRDEEVKRTAGTMPAIEAMKKVREMVKHGRRK